jgi:hypothetical protein
MYLLSRAPIIDVNPSDGKEYEYSLEFIRPMNDENTHYLYNFKRTLYSIDQSTSSTHNDTRALLIELSEAVDSDLDKLCRYPGKYWYYYSNKYNHYTPKKIYCKFNREDVLVYTVDQCTPRVLEEFNKVLKMYDVTEGPKYGFPMPDSCDNNKIGYGPIFEINIWIPRDKTVREALTEDIRHWISEYINNTFEGDDNDEQDNR